MKMSAVHRLLPLFAVALVAPFALGLSGCSNTREGAEKDAEILSEQAREQARELEVDARRGAEKAKAASSEFASDVKDVSADVMAEAKEGAQKAGVVTSQALDEAGQRAAAAGRTLEVKTALMGDERVDASRINVDSDHSLQVIHLRGAVSTDAEKTAAESIAIAKSSGWKVSNELVVIPKQ